MQSTSVMRCGQLAGRYRGQTIGQVPRRDTYGTGKGISGTPFPYTVPRYRPATDGTQGTWRTDYDRGIFLDVPRPGSGIIYHSIGKYISLGSSPIF